MANGTCNWPHLQRDEYHRLLFYDSVFMVVDVGCYLGISLLRNCGGDFLFVILVSNKEFSTFL